MEEEDKAVGQEETLLTPGEGHPVEEGEEEEAGGNKESSVNLNKQRHFNKIAVRSASIWFIGVILFSCAFFQVCTLYLSIRNYVEEGIEGHF